jgi:dTDP-4-dehydrorhamnose 3,5-epimerase
MQPVDIRQVIVTSTRPGSLRGMHYHLRQSDVAYVASGRVFMALLDLRDARRKREAFWLDDSESVFIPPGVAHGYASEVGAVVFYLLTREADSSDEFGFRFDDAQAAIRWPVAAPILSERDHAAGTLEAAAAHVHASLIDTP